MLKRACTFLAYSFTSDDLTAALLERYQTGVDVAGVMEARQVESNTGSDYERLRAAGIDVRLDGNPDNMHHKVLIIDGQTVVTGSFNFSRSAEERNDENSLVMSRSANCRPLPGASSSKCLQQHKTSEKDDKNRSILGPILR